jgi:phage-related protein
MPNFKECLNSEIYRSHSSQITIDNFLAYSKNCIVTKEKVFYEKSETSVSSVVKGYFSIGFKPGKMFNSSTYKDKKYISIKREEISDIEDEIIRNFAIQTYQIELKETQRNAKELEELKNKELEELESKKRVELEIISEISNELIDFFNQFDSNNNGTIDILEFDVLEFRDAIKNNSQVIISQNPEYLKNLLQLNEYIIGKNKKLNEIYLKIKNISVVDVLNTREIPKFQLTESEYRLNPVKFKFEIAQRISEVKGISVTRSFEMLQNGEFEWSDTAPEGLSKFDITALLNYYRREIFIYENELSLGFVMIFSISKNDLMSFFEVYNTFDKQRVFDSQYQREVTNNLDEINEGVSQLNVNVISLIGKLDSLNEALSSQLFQINSNLVDYQAQIVEGFNAVESKLAFNNVIAGIQNYQLYKINNNLKKH